MRNSVLKCVVLKKIYRIQLCSYVSDDVTSNFIFEFCYSPFNQVITVINDKKGFERETVLKLA